MRLERKCDSSRARYGRSSLPAPFGTRRRCLIDEGARATILTCPFGLRHWPLSICLLATTSRRRVVINDCYVGSGERSGMPPHMFSTDVLRPETEVLMLSRDHNGHAE